FGPLLFHFGSIDAFRAAYGMCPRELGHSVFRRDFSIAQQREARTRDGQTSPRTTEFEPHFRLPGARFAMRPQRREPWILDQSVLRVRRLAVVLEGEATADAGDRGGALHVEVPVDDVERVGGEVGHLAAGVIPKPTKVVDRTVRVIAALGR